MQNGEGTISEKSLLLKPGFLNIFEKFLVVDAAANHFQLGAIFIERAVIF